MDATEDFLICLQLFAKEGERCYIYIYSNCDDTTNSKSLSRLWFRVFVLKVFIQHFLSSLPTMSAQLFYITPQWLLWIEFVWIRHYLFLCWVSVIRIFCFITWVWPITANSNQAHRPRSYKQVPLLQLFGASVLS